MNARTKPQHVRVVARTPHPTKLWLRALWLEVKASRISDAAAKLENTFMEVARKSGLVAAVHALSHHGEEDVRHVIRRGLLNRDPWGKEFVDG